MNDILKITITDFELMDPPPATFQMLGIFPILNKKLRQLDKKAPQLLFDTKKYQESLLEHYDIITYYRDVNTGNLIFEFRKPHKII